MLVLASRLIARVSIAAPFVGRCWSCRQQGERRSFAFVFESLEIACCSLRTRRGDHLGQPGRQRRATRRFAAVLRANARDLVDRPSTIGRVILNSIACVRIRARRHAADLAVAAGVTNNITWMPTASDLRRHT